MLESYARGKNDSSIYLTHRGFQPISGETNQYLDLRFLQKNSNSIHYLKLHGSIDWWKRDDGKIVISDSNQSQYGEKLIEHIMIYPIYEKYISLEPFYSLYGAFRNILFGEELTIVIGYSFRDISINNAFLDHLRTNKNARMIISCKSYSVKERINKIFNECPKRIDLINKYFAEDDFINELKTTLRHNNKNMLKSN